MTHLTLLLAAVIALSAPQAPTENLLVNGTAREGTAGWRPSGRATTEHFMGTPCFAVQWKGSFAQDVVLPPGAAGTYAALVGAGQSDRIHSDRTITGLPYLYAMVWTPDRKRVVDYWQGMIGRPAKPDEWVTMSGVFKVPEDAAFVQVQLNQAEASGTPQNGSAARFADVRLRLFATEDSARAFIHRYPER